MKRIQSTILPAYQMVLNRIQPLAQRCARSLGLLCLFQKGQGSEAFYFFTVFIKYMNKNTFVTLMPRFSSFSKYLSISIMYRTSATITRS